MNKGNPFRSCVKAKNGDEDVAEYRHCFQTKHAFHTTVYPPCNPHPPRPPTTPARALPTAFQSFDTQRSQATRHCGDHHHHHCDLLLPDHYHNHHPRNPPFPCYPLATFVEFDDRFDDTDLLNGNAVQTFTNFPFNPGYSTRNFDDYFPKVHHPLPSNEYVAKDRVFRPLDRSQFYRSTGIFIHSNCIANFLKPSSTERLYRQNTRMEHERNRYSAMHRYY